MDFVILFGTIMMLITTIYIFIVYLIVLFFEIENILGNLKVAYFFIVVGILGFIIVFVTSVLILIKGV